MKPVIDLEALKHDIREERDLLRALKLKRGDLLFQLTRSNKEIRAKQRKIMNLAELPARAGE